MPDVSLNESTHASRPNSIASPVSERAWRIALDTGGTFTDVIARSPLGHVTRIKVPSDGSISATVRRCDGRRLVFTATARLQLPDGFLDGWIVAISAREAQSHATITIDRHSGDMLLLSRALSLPAGATLRFVQRENSDATARATIDAPRLAMHIVTATPLHRTLPPLELRLSTTRATNALLQGLGARVGVIVAQGLEGVVQIGDQTRDDLFARVPRPRVLFAHAVRSIDERTLADGSVLARASADEIRHAARELIDAGCERIVVSLAHALVDGGRESEVADVISAMPVACVAASRVAAHPRLLTRTDTAIIDSRIDPIVRAFVCDATHSAKSARTYAFTSAGVLQPAAAIAACETLFSGPAGGARAVTTVALRHGITHAVSFDMGGTSSDVTRFAQGSIPMRAQSTIARASVATPSLAIDSVAAGGGSICSVRDGAFEVGPHSAGSNPGPACYGRGGPLTISDINVLAGRMVSDFESISVEREPAQALIAQVASERACSETAAIAAFLDIANARMALAIENLCVRDGVNPRAPHATQSDARSGAPHTLIAFGGAGGQHACPIAERLELTRIVFPRFAGFMCAQGVFDATSARLVSVPVLALLESSEAQLAHAREDALQRARDLLHRDGFAVAPHHECLVALRLLGQESSIEVEFNDLATMNAAFRSQFEGLFGYQPPARAIEIECVRVVVHALDEGATSAQGSPTHDWSPPIDGASTPYDRVPMLSAGTVVDAALFARNQLPVGRRIDGPALIVDVGETVVIDVGWRAEVHGSGDLVATRTTPLVRGESAAQSELFAARLESIAVSMGHVLERTALSPNIRDRLDFSCAVLDHEGTLVQNAPHLPVHLGALGVCVRAVAAAIDLAQGDIAVTNHPAFGGSHLPDVTTVAPVFLDGRRVGYVAVRAHHAEIGGTRPGSFPPDAQSLAEEGVVLPPFLAVRAGAFDEASVRARFADGPYPSRNPHENLADFLAQVAATRHGIDGVKALAREGGAEDFAARCQRELDRAQRMLTKRLQALQGVRRAQRFLDDGTRLAVELEVINDRLAIRFEGCEQIHPRNFNAPRAVTQAAVLYALRLFVDEKVPMNEGLMRAVDLSIPSGMLNPQFDSDPTRCPPVVAGNVETSQTVVALLIDALDLAAESQSTMNNVLFGNESFGIYETLGGGAGAGADQRGASGVHVHMSNTRLTDIDVLERRAPVVIRAFHLRANSGGDGATRDGDGASRGGDGATRGGDGLVRHYQFRAPVSLSFFGSRRRYAPQGAHGGGDGMCGAQRAIIGGITRDCSDSVLALELAAGDEFIVETPGGGGFGFGA